MFDKPFRVLIKPEGCLMRDLGSCVQRPPIWLVGFISICVIILITVLSRDEMMRDKTNDLLVKIKLGLPERSWFPVAFGDLFRSHSTDILYVNGSRTKIGVFSRSKDKKSFSRTQEIPMVNRTVQSVLLCDFRNTGYNDLVVVTKSQKTSELVYLENNRGVISRSFVTIDTGVDDMLMIIGCPHSQRACLLGYNHVRNKHMLYQFDTEPTEIDSTKKYDKIERYVDHDGNILIAGLNKKSHVIDLLKLEDRSLKIVNSIVVPEGAVNVLVADFNRDGHFDLLVPVRRNKNEAFLCLIFGNKTGLNSTQKCTEEYTHKYMINDLVDDPKHFHIGDIALDGRPSISVPIQSSSGQYKTRILHNTQMTSQKLEFENVGEVDGLGGLLDIDDNGELGVVTFNGSYTIELSRKLPYLKVSVLNQNLIEDVMYPASLATINYDSWIELKYTDKSGRVKRLSNIQSSSPLSLPFLSTGFDGRVHYIQEMTVHSIHKDEFKWILPNSHVFVSSNHEMRVFLKYPVQATYVMYGCVFLLFLLSVLIILYMEKEEDEDKQESALVLPLF